MTQNRLHHVSRHLARDGPRTERVAEGVSGRVGKLQQIFRAEFSQCCCLGTQSLHRHANDPPNASTV